MSRNGDEIAQLTADTLGVPPWPAVGNAVARYLGRAVYYLSAVAAAGLPQSLVGTPPATSLLTASPSASVPAFIAQAATVPGLPGLSIWPAHRMMLHLLTRASFLQLGDTYGILITLAQVDAAGAVVTTIGHHTAPGDQFFTGDMDSPDWQWNDLPIDVPQIANSAGLRLAVSLEILTTATSPVYVELSIGGLVGSCIDTSLVSAGAGGPDTDRKVAADTDDAEPGVLFDKLESDGSILITVDTAGAAPAPPSDPAPSGSNAYYFSQMGETG